MPASRVLRALSFACILVLSGASWGQVSKAPIEPQVAGRPANGNGSYLALRSDLPQGDGYAVKDFTLERQGGSFHFDQGSFYLYAPVNGQVTGAVFVGKGHFALTVKDVAEQQSLRHLTKSDAMSQDFTIVVLRFSDETPDEIRKASSGSAGTPSNAAIDAAVDLAKNFRKDLHENLELRLLEDVMIHRTGSFFLAQFRMGAMLAGRNVLFIVDPEGTFHAAPDQVELTTWSTDELNTWAAYKLSGTSGGGLPVVVTDQKLDVTIEKSGMLHGSAETTVKLRRDGLRVMRLQLYRTLRVAGVYDDRGKPLDFIQEDKDLDPNFAVILPEGLKADAPMRLLTRYAGKEVVSDEGQGNYDLNPSARDSWYPSNSGGFGQYTNFDMIFHLPKDLEIVATGQKVSAGKEDGGTRAEWKTSSPIEVAGFNLGQFKSNEARTPQGFTVSAYADQDLPDWIKPYVRLMSLGTMSTVPALNDELQQGIAAIQVYSDFFGKLPYDHLALTQQTACNFGQSWPMLVYLPLCAFWDSTIQQRLGILYLNRSYWQDVTPHEVSHQWWGTLVGFDNYRDQWMSEGFANFSVGVYLLRTRPKMDDYRDFWNEQKKNLLDKNAQGHRPIDVGPLTMGARVNNEKVGDNIYSMLIYSKGAYIMHMIEMLWWTPGSGQAPFKKSIQNFVTEYSGKVASTEDFKASFERSMPKWADINGDGKLDWFFNEYVYGTELPHYTIASDFSVADGVTSAHFKLSQSGISKNFVMPVPLYLQMADGSTTFLGKVTLRGQATAEQTVKLGKLPSPAKKMLVNYNADVLSD